MSKVVWTQSAIDDLSAIRDYIARDSEFYAEKFVDDVFLATERLEAFPESGSIVPERNRTDFREIIFSSYRIIYRLKKDNVYIITIIHGKRDYKPEK